jgi:RNA polymerase sigma factor (sigma-70 family)
VVYVCAECQGGLATDVDAAFPTFVAHHQDLVYGVALRLTGRSTDAEELAQDAFVRAYRALKGYPAERVRELRPRGWLATIVTNLGRDRRRRRRPATVGLEAAGETPAPDARSGPHAVLERRESARAWRARLEALPRRYRDAVALRHVDGLSYAELASVLGRPMGTVKSDVYRGVRMLREAWLAEEAEPATGPRTTVQDEPVTGRHRAAAREMEP